MKQRKGAMEVGWQEAGLRRKSGTVGRLEELVGGKVGELGVSLENRTTEFLLQRGKAGEMVGQGVRAVLVNDLGPACMRGVVWHGAKKGEVQRKELYDTFKEACSQELVTVLFSKEEAPFDHKVHKKRVRWINMLGMENSVWTEGLPGTVEGDEWGWVAVMFGSSPEVRQQVLNLLTEQEDRDINNMHMINDQEEIPETTWECPACGMKGQRLNNIYGVC